GSSKFTVSRPGSLLDTFCSRCHMPTNYVDNYPLRNVKVDPTTGIETAVADPNFNPTSDNGTGVAFATLESQFRNTESGKAGIFCAVCHSYAATRDTPFHNYAKAPRLVRRRGRPAGARTARAAAGDRHPVRRRSVEEQPWLRDRRRRVPPVAA